MRFSIDHVLALSKGIFNPYLLFAFLPYILYRDQSVLNLLKTQPLGRPLLEPLLNAFLNTLRNSQDLLPLTIPPVLGALYDFNTYLNRRIVDSGIKDRYNWPKEIAVITGGAGAVGSATAESLLSLGVGTIILLDLREPPAHLLKDPRVHFYRCDISSFPSVQSTVHTLKTAHGVPTILILASGLLHTGTLISTPSANLTASIHSNLLGPMHILKTLVPPMTIPNHGHIISLTSSLSALPLPFTLDFSASELALQHVLQGLQSETFNYYRASRLRYSSITTGLIKTPLTSYARLPNTFLYPHLEVSDVTAKIIDILKSGDSTNVMLPKAGYVPYFIARFCPDWLRWTTQYCAARMQVFAYLRPTEVVGVDGKSLMERETPQFEEGHPKEWWDYAS
ncbi:NAD(P)-binding protein [Ascobolus immersus RN42]|uniref:NAD(P)-binding protein n=1 Tax=Ascobolus immersus RN42 TaxID=1160509 RepID=A0A3N4IND5_ASCIM|nr:NAD(P)-binding protein [Ascobolus immersus RN42]